MQIEFCRLLVSRLELIALLGWMHQSFVKLNGVAKDIRFPYIDISKTIFKQNAGNQRLK